MKKINYWKILINVMFALLFVMGLFIILSFFPIKGNYRIFSVMSGSMEPTIKTGSAILVEPRREYKVGDIISFQSASEQKTTTHRIVEIDQKSDTESYFTKGDANDAKDAASITKEKVIGKKVLTIAYLGYLLSYAKTLPGLIIIIILSLVIIIGEVNNIKYESRNIIKNRNKKG